MPSRATDIIDRVRRVVLASLGWIIIGALVIRAAAHVAAVIQDVRWDGDTSYPESAIVERALSVARGEPLYGDCRHWPYNAAVYGPLAYYPAAWMARAAGLEPDRYSQAVQIKMAGRAVSLASGLAILLGLWAVAPAIGLSGAWRFLAPLLFFSCFRIIGFGNSFRPDFPMVALSTWGWVIALRGRNRIHFAAAVALMAAAVFVKHTALVSAVALCLCLAATGRRRDAARFAAGFVALVAAGALALIVAARGAWLVNNFGALRSPFFPGGSYHFLFLLAPQELIPIGAGLAILLGALGGKREIRPLRWAFGFALLGAELAAMRTGSNINYYLEAHCWGCVAAAACAQAATERLRSRVRQGAPPWPAWAVILCIFVVPFVSQSLFFLSDLPQRLKPKDPFAARYPKTIDLLRRARGPILTAEPNLYWFSPSPPTLMDPFLYTVRVAAGALLTQELEGKIQRREFEWIILSWDASGETPTYQRLPMLPPEVTRAIAQYYRPEAQEEDFRIYRPATADR